MSEVREFAPDWMYDCLEEAKKIINTYHYDFDCKEFLENSEFRLFLQIDRPNAYGYIRLGLHPLYNIGIHKNMEKSTPENTKMVVVVLIHELLHALHPDAGHNEINPLERRFANKAGYYDALRNMEIMYLSGQMRFCDE